jgi:CheY-like chemotaxis protein
VNAPLPREGLRAFETVDGGRSSRGRPARSAEVPWPSQARISLCVVGLDAAERRRLHRLVDASVRRAPLLVLVDESRAHEADVVLVDATDDHARAWSRSRPWLDGRAVLWVGRLATRAGHLELPRPIAWATLPIVLADAMGHAPVASRAVAVRALQPHSPAVLLLGGAAPAGNRLPGLLEACGRRVVQAATARDGLAALHAARYDAVILAGQVPDLDRLALCARLRSLQGRIGRLPLLLLLDGPKVPAWARLRARMAGYDEVAAMPGGIAELQAVLGRLPVAVPRAAPSDAPGPSAG